jgi:O-methyltransferase involved in polyketide biosynthesis
MTVPESVGRMYHYALDGKDHYAVDRAATDELLEAVPRLRAAAAGNRRFLQRAVAFAAGQGIGQFLDLGSGLPAEENTHEVARKVNPDARVAYVDRDSAAITHGRALLADGESSEHVLMLDGDIREPGPVTGLLRYHLDFSRPVAVMMVAVLHFVPGPGCHELVAGYMGRVPDGSMLILSHASADNMTAAEEAKVYQTYQRVSQPVMLRRKEEITRFFAGLDLAGPGVTGVADWPAGPAGAAPPLVYCGVAWKAAR